jgi:hypothetical protein
VIVQYRGPVTALSALDARINTDALERELTARKMELDLEELERLRQADEARRRTELERQRQLQPQDPWLPTRPATAQHAICRKAHRRLRRADAPAQRDRAGRDLLRRGDGMKSARRAAGQNPHPTALDSPLAPRVASMRDISCEMGTPSSPAACLRASQNGLRVRWRCGARRW